MTSLKKSSLLITMDSINKVENSIRNLISHKAIPIFIVDKVEKLLDHLMLKGNKN